MEDQLLNSLMTAYLAQIDSALKIGKIISEHSGDNERDFTRCPYIWFNISFNDSNER